MAPSGQSQSGPIGPKGVPGDPELGEGLAGVLGRWSAGSGPLYQQLAEALRGAITRGELVTGSRLPPERRLAAEFNVSRSTVVAAYGLLERDGLLGRRQGSGTWVRSAGRSTAVGSDRAGGRIRAAKSYRGLVEGPDDTIEFTVAALPGTDPLRAELLSRALPDIEEAARHHGYRVLGHQPLREAIAAHLSGLALPTTADQVIVTNGAQQAIGLVAALLVGPGETVVIESPTYLGAIDVFAAAGARMIPAPMGPQGLRVGGLREILAGSSPRLVYLQASFQNPTGVLMPEAPRRELAELFGELGLPAIQDDTLADLPIDREPPPPIAAFAPEAPMLQIGSLSKLFWGGLRVGWIRAAEPMIARLARVKLVVDHGSSIVSQVLATRLFDDVEEFRKVRRRQIADRLQLLTSLLAEHLPGWTWDRPVGGLSLWARLPVGSAVELAPVALRHGVTIVPGDLNTVDGGFADHVRLPFVHDDREMQEGIGRLGEAWREYAPRASEAPRSVKVVV